jgi:hypothetical protein
MRNMLLMSVAATALIAGSGLASAQGPNQSREGSSQAPAAQPNAPAEKISPMKGASENKTPDAGLKAGQTEQKIAPSVGQTEQKAAPGIKAGQTQQMEPKRANPQQAQDNTKDGMKPKGLGSETQSQIKSDGKTNLDAKADGKPAPDVKADTKSSEKVGAKTSITGQGAGVASLSTEQRTTIRTVIRQQNVQPVSNVNFSISVGSRVSDNVHFYPVPTELVQIQPNWRGYEFILVGDQIIVVNPHTHQIVAVLDA